MNLPEFVNIPQDGLMAIATPAVDMYKKFDHAAELGDKGHYDTAIVDRNDRLNGFLGSLYNPVLPAPRVKKEERGEKSWQVATEH